MRASYRARRLHPFAAALLCLGVSCAQGGCVTSPVAEAGHLDVKTAIARGELQSPKAAAVAMASIDGAPGPIAQRFKQDIASEAASREITFTDASLARYVVRGYLDAYATETGTSVHSVWDVYDSTRRRTRRIDDAFDLPASGGPDPWAGVSDEVLAGMASKSTDDLAIVLGQTPEAGGAPAQAASVAVPGHAID